MNRRDFLILSSLFASVGVLACAFPLRFLNKSEQKMTGKVVPSVQIPLIEHCNLSCKYCCHFSCIAEKTEYNFEHLKNDIEKLSVLSEKKIEFIIFTGGEPLLYPYLTEIFEIARKNFPDTNISINTNSLLLNSMKENFWLSVKNNNIEIRPSFYPVKINWDSILKKSKKYGVKIMNYLKETEFKLTDLQEATIRNFGKINIDKYGNQVNSSAVNCNAKYCHTLKNGKLFLCSIPAFIEHLNKKFKTNFQVTENDFLDIYKVKAVDDILEFININKIDFCKYCTQIQELYKWENSLEHSVDEWVYEK